MKRLILLLAMIASLILASAALAGDHPEYSSAGARLHWPIDSRGISLISIKNYMNEASQQHSSLAGNMQLWADRDSQHLAMLWYTPAPQECSAPDSPGGCPGQSGFVSVFDHDYGAVGWAGRTWYWSYPDGRIDRADIMVNLSTVYYNLPENTACHEMGHAIGVDHNNDPATYTYSCIRDDGCPDCPYKASDAYTTPNYYDILTVDTSYGQCVSCSAGGMALERGFYRPTPQLQIDRALGASKAAKLKLNKEVKRLRARGIAVHIH